MVAAAFGGRRPPRMIGAIGAIGAIGGTVRPADFPRNGSATGAPACGPSRQLISGRHPTVAKRPG